jgi:glycosyltransferase involved in cell wall biosynthesis
MRKLLYRYCGRVHTVSESLKQYLVELGFPKHKITTVLNGVDCERFRPVRERSHLRQAIGIPEDAFVLGMVGRLIVSKRHEMVLEALDRLVAEHSEVFLLVVGDGGDHREAILRAMETHHYRDHILWVGHQADPAPYYQCMDLLVMPSSVEGLSNALLESMACAVPCLAHPACGASEVVEDGVDGYLREMDSDSDLAAELIRILENRVGVEEIGRNARKTAKENFSLEKMVNGYADLYRDVAARRLEASGL